MSVGGRSAVRVDVVQRKSGTAIEREEKEEEEREDDEERERGD